MTRKIVAVDMDDTIAALLKYVREVHNTRFPESKLEIEDIIPFKDDVYDDRFNIQDFLSQPGTFYNLEPIDEHVIEELKLIHEKHDLVIVTASFPEAVVDKWKWLQKYLPFIPYRNFIVAQRKDLIQADILIDDAIHNVRDWVTTGRTAIVPIHHWNKELIELDGVIPIYGWHGMSEIVDSVLQLEEA